jgi:hypothetical protein
VLLASALTARLGGGHGGSLGAAAHLSAATRHVVAPKMAAAFGHTFVWAVVLLVVALISSLALPKRKPELAPGETPAPMMV